MLKAKKEELQERGVKGFTLMEMLIVVAIIAVLVAIAIPVFTSQLERSKESTDLANIRAAYATATAQAIQNGSTASASAPAAGQGNAAWEHESGELVVMNDSGTSKVSFSGKQSGDYVVTVYANGSCTVV